jgi:D-galactonate transporter
VSSIKPGLPGSRPAAPSAAESVEYEDLIYRKAFWRFVPLLMLCFMAAYLDRVNVGFARLQMLEDLRFSDTVYGLGAGIFFIGYFLFEIPSNVIMHRVGARRWIARILITWGVISGAMMFVDTPLSFYVLRFLLGVAEAGFFPGVILYLTYWFPSARRGRITALFMMAVPLSGVVGNPLTGWILQRFDRVGGWAGWQWVFLLEAIPPVVLGCIVLVRLDDRIDAASWLSSAEKHLLERNIAADIAHGSRHDLAAVVREPRVWLMAFIYFGICMGLYGVSFWMPTIVRNSGIQGATMIGMLSAIPPAFTIVAMILNSAHSDRSRERRWHVALPCVLGALGLALCTVAHGHTTIALTALTLANVGIMAAAPVFWSLPTAVLSGVAAAAGIALINSIGNLAGFVSPYLVGWLKDVTGSTDSGIYILALFLLLGGIATLTQSRAVVNK